MRCLVCGDDELTFTEYMYHLYKVIECEKCGTNFRQVNGELFELEEFEDDISDYPENLFATTASAWVSGFQQVNWETLEETFGRFGRAIEGIRPIYVSTGDTTEHTTTHIDWEPSSAQVGVWFDKVTFTGRELPTDNE